MQQTRAQAIEFFRSAEPAGYRFLNRSHGVEFVDRLPAIDETGDLANAEWFAEATATGEFIDLETGVAAEHTTTVRVLASDEGLLLAARMIEPDPKSMRRLIAPDHPSHELEIEGAAIPYPARCDDNVQFFIDPDHDHRSYYHAFVTHAGFARLWTKRYHYAESVHPICDLHEAAEGPWEQHVAVAGDAWHAFIRLPWKTLGVDGPPEPRLVGFNALRVRSIGGLAYSAWTRMPGPHSPVAADFGDLYLGRARAFVDAVDFARPVLDDNVVRVTVRALVEPVELTARTRTGVQETGQPPVCEQASAEVPAGESVTVEIPYRLDWQQRRPHEVVVELEADGEVFHRSRYDAGRFVLVCATDRHEFDGPQSDPSPDDPDFVTKKRNYLLSRIPRFERRTTLQGAPSDFCIAAADDSVAFNLMQPGVCARIAAYIEGLFGSDLDRQAAASLMIHQKAFAMHCGPLTSMHGDMSPESAMRLGGGHCYSRAIALAGVMREMRDSKTDRNLDATILFVLGHVIVCVRGGGERILFDPTFGSFFYRHDNRGFATERELADDLSLADRYIVDRHKDYFHPASHSPAPVGSVSWPAAAQAE